MAWSEVAKTSDSWDEVEVVDQNTYDGSRLTYPSYLAGFYYGGGLGDRLSVTLPWSEDQKVQSSWSEQ